MAVFRVERTQNYTIMSNYHLRDKSISLCQLHQLQGFLQRCGRR